MIWGCFAEFSGVRFLARYSEWEPHLGGSATRLRDRDGSLGHHSVGRAGSRWRRHRLCGIQNGVISVFFSQHRGHASDRVLRKCPSVSTEVRSHLEPSYPPCTGCRALCLSEHIWLLSRQPWQRTCLHHTGPPVRAGGGRGRGERGFLEDSIDTGFGRVLLVTDLAKHLKHVFYMKTNSFM